MPRDMLHTMRRRLTRYLGTASDQTLVASSLVMKSKSLVRGHLISSEWHPCVAARADKSTPTVLLQAMKQDPPADTKCRDKFLVQSVLISGDLEFSNVQTIVSYQR